MNYQQDDLGALDRDGITTLLIARTGAQRGIGSFGVSVDDADGRHAELIGRGLGLRGSR